MNTMKRDEQLDNTEAALPIQSLLGVEPYRPTPRRGIDLLLDSNEGTCPTGSALDRLRAIDPEQLRRYPDKSSLESQIAARLGVGDAQILVTAGGDEVIDRVCRAYLDRDRSLVQHVPTFEMIARSAGLTGASVRSVRWMNGSLPRESIIEAAGSQRCVIAIVSPNNPTGAVIDARDLRAISEACSRSVILLDLAYTEFADIDLTPVGLELPNVIMIRTLSKAYGLAGLRIGFAVGSTDLIAPLRAVGGPYPVSSVSLLIAESILKDDDDAVFAATSRIRQERRELFELLGSLGAESFASQGNFVLCRVGSSERVDAALRARGIAVRRFTHDPALMNCLRITCPGSHSDFQRLIDTLQSVAAEAPADFAVSQTS